MYCPNCGNKNTQGQKFCRSCGLGLEKVEQSLNDQLPIKADKSLQERKERLESLGVAALSVFGLGLLGFILYSAFSKLILTQGKVLAGLAVLGLVVILGCGLLSVILFAKAKEVKEGSAKRRMQEPTELAPDHANAKSLGPHADPVFSVTERTTELLDIEKGKQQE